ncbi:aldolase/citrate lyase family protein [uncultured Paracoccus sp.]|uniref:aldolase/citrate lyase family protein n=1 Tax=uncultured Paracoccus sp. TaxID=189685 RepID=UPI002638D533|nr:aldolase/citrate lyase family protein [uncultured Paracoccus sp.]
MPNRFKTALAEGRPQIGLWLGLADHYAAELVAGAGFDWLVIDGEHAPNDIRSTLAQAQAIAPYHSHAVARAPVGHVHLVKQYLDIGIQTLLIPMIDTAEQAAEMAAAMRYPPDGIRGVASAVARVSGFDRDAGYLARADDDACLLVQVETTRGIDNLAAIAGTDGVDGVFIGPADLSAAMGHLGDPGHPDVQATVEAAIATVRDAGKAPGIIAEDVAQARRYLALGALFVAVGTDVGLLRRATDTLLAQFRNGDEPAFRGDPG